MEFQVGGELCFYGRKPWSSGVLLVEAVAVVKIQQAAYWKG